MMKTAYLVQSYEEVPFLMFLLSLRKLDEKIIILNYGNGDLERHLIKILPKKDITLINNTLENQRKFKRKGMYLLTLLFFTLKHLWILIFLVKRVDKIYFFGPFLSLLISSIGTKQQKKVCYEPLPGLVKRKLIKQSGEYTKNSFINKKESKIRRLLMRVFFGKNCQQRFIGSTKISAITEEAIDIFIKNNNRTDFLLQDYEHYQNNIYPTLIRSFTQKDLELRVIYFEQHYLERNLVYKMKYIELIKNIAELCMKRGIQFYIKPHPGKELPKIYHDIDNINFIEAETPSEFYVNQNTICISTSSGALGGSLCKLNLSLIFLMPFIDEVFRKNVFRALANKINIPTYTPRTLNDIDMLLLSSKNSDLNDCNIDLIKPQLI